MAPRRTLLISGASRGIGFQIARLAHRAGHRLSLGLRGTVSLEDLGLPSDGSVMLHPYEADDPSSAEPWVAATIRHFGSLDGLIHCAGIFSRVGLLFNDGEEREIERTWRINLMGPWWLTRAAWPHLMAHGDARVIVLSSMSGKRVKNNLTAYAASKFALMALCQSIRSEGWDHGLRVTAICPGWVNTSMTDAVTALSKAEMTQPEDLAVLIGELLALPPSCVPFEITVNCLLEA